jgi:MSHA pilin protein MshD
VYIGFLSILGQGCDLCTKILTRVGPDAGETSEEAYDDVDDYNGYAISNVGGNYNGFAYRVGVTYDSSIESDLNKRAPKQYKRIDIAVTAPDGQVYNFSAYRGSY